jgi:putative NADH-flavin reductase
MNVLVLGATGRLGRRIVTQALAAGHDVTAMVRNPAKVKLKHERLRVIQGNAFDSNALDRALQGQQAAIYSLGRSLHFLPTRFFSDSTRILIAAMEKQRVRRLVCVTGIGAGDSWGHGGIIYDFLIYPLITRPTYKDKDRQEELIRRSALNWVIVRPASFAHFSLGRKLRVATNLKGVTIRSVTLADTAQFVVQQLTSDQYLGQTPLVGY